MQRIGEGRANKDEISAASQKVTDAVELFRTFYEEAYDRTTDALTRNGYDKPGYIQKYFPHIDKAQGILEKLGFSFENSTLPTSINGLTETFTPGRQYSGFLQHREGKTTDYDALYGFEQYINSVSNVIYHTDDIQRLRQLETEIRAAAKNGVFDDVKGKKAPGGESTHLSEFVKWVHEYTNLLAGKKSIMDRGAESMAGRAVYGGLNRLKSMKGAAAVMGNIGSAVTNMVPVTQIIAEHPVATMKGVSQMLRECMSGKMNVPVSQFKVRRFGSDSVIQTGYSKFSSTVSKPFELVDLFATNLIVNSYYQYNLDMGMDSETAMRNADAQAARLMGDRSKGAQATMYGGKIVGFLTQFQFEIANQSQHFRKDIWREHGAGKALSTLLMTAITGWLWNELQEKITGRRSAADPIEMTRDMIDAAMQGEGPMPVVQACYNSVSEMFPYIGGGRIAAFDSLSNVFDELTGGSPNWVYVGEQLSAKGVEG